MDKTSGKPRGENKLQGKYLSLIIVVLFSLFAVSLFKNISYPLLWADESMTVMHGERVLEYGYPKVHDGRNVLYDLRHPDLALGIDEKTDAYIGGANWGMYYVAAAAVKLAELSKDIYTKTAVLRIPFAFAGLTGLILFALLGAQFFNSRSSQKGFLILFAFFELISVPLVLHLREARYYPLAVFMIALVVLIYARYVILKKGGYLMYAALLTVSLFFLFITFSPAYFIFLAAISCYESMAFAAGYVKKRDRTDSGIPFSFNRAFKKYLLDLLPLVLSLIAVSPLIFFFKTFYIAEEMKKFNTLSAGVSGWDMYLANLSVIWRYFTSFDLIYCAIFLKVCLLYFLIKFSIRNIPSRGAHKLEFSNFLTVTFIVYFVLIARIPNFPFTRYLIPLQPVLAVIIILDLALVYNLVSVRSSSGNNRYKAVLLCLFAGFTLINISKNMDYLKGHVYELTHQYKGPLDYLIPFIRETYGDTDTLVIATNYEETSFMYYLKSRVIVGYVGNNLEQDLQMVPDIVIFRKGWRNLDPKIFVNFLERGRYQRISFPVFDYNVNNIPELNLSPAYQHQFRTLNTGNEDVKTDIFLKE